MTWRLSPRAEADLAQILDTIAADHPAAARAWLARMERAFHAIAASPGLGVAREDVRPGLRVHAVGRYLVLYRATDGVAVVRVIHGARLWARLL